MKDAAGGAICVLPSAIYWLEESRDHSPEDPIKVPRMARAKCHFTKNSETQSSLHQYQLLKAMARGHAEQLRHDIARLSLARAYCTAILVAYWNALRQPLGVEWDMPHHGLTLVSLPSAALDLTFDIGELVATFPAEDAGYLIGSIYTVMLPEKMRSDMGAYYTPPPMVKRLLDLAEIAGTDFSSCTVIDPACGGGAFLAPVALRMLKHATQSSAKIVLADIVTRLRGIELDPFAAWMTQVLLETSLLPICAAANERIPQVITVADALQHDGIGTFDLVIGNPPYGRVKLDDVMRARYARSLYGHANLYGLFTDLATRLVKRGGVIAYLTPTSFLGGQYYKALRKMLTSEMAPVAFDFIADREGVFDSVLQETILVAYRQEKTTRAATVSLILPQGLEQASIEPVGEVLVPNSGDPWIIPRSAQDASYVQAASKMAGRLSDWGYRVSTGQLVWNRHKPQLRQTIRNGELPIIWAESVTAAGFSFSAERRNHAPYIALNEQQHLVTRNACVLLQRTTAKEQERRLLSAVIPQTFIDQYGGVVVENHLNIIYAPGSFEIAPTTVSTILNSAAVDRVFRCINGSVAVSAYELESLPLPSVEQAKAVEAMLQQGASRTDVESRIVSFYELNA